jgi:hypothetical protein
MCDVGDRFGRAWFMRLLSRKEYHKSLGREAKLLCEGCCGMICSGLGGLGKECLRKALMNRGMINANERDIYQACVAFL